MPLARLITDPTNGIIQHSPRVPWQSEERGAAVSVWSTLESSLPPSAYAADDRSPESLPLSGGRDRWLLAPCVSYEITIPTATTTSIRATIATPTYPSTKPAIAMPRPLWVSLDSLICFNAMWPNTTARIEPTQ